MGKKNVLVVGGGFAGMAALSVFPPRDFNVVLLDPKTFFEHVPASPHSLLAPASAPRTLVDFPACWNHKQGLLVGLTSDGDKGTASLQGGDTIDFDYCILCTGSSYPAGIKPPTDRLTDRASRLQEFSTTAEKVAAAQSVVVVGGGSVGVEVASEVAEAYPDKKVTLVCSGGLLDRMDGKARDFAAAWLDKHGVEVLTGERISDWGGLGDGLPVAATLATASGRVIQADVVFKCLGVRPATQLFAESLQEGGRLAHNGSIAVEPTLQVKGWRNVFAVGDCCDTSEEKTAALAGVAGAVAANNVLALEAGKELQTFPEGTFGGHTPPTLGGFTLGTRAGVFQNGSDVQMGAGPAKIKDIITWLVARVAAGSGFWSWVYGGKSGLGGMRALMIKGATKEAKKAADAKKAAAAAAAVVAAADPAAMPAAVRAVA